VFIDFIETKLHKKIHKSKHFCILKEYA